MLSLKQIVIFLKQAYTLNIDWANNGLRFSRRERAQRAKRSAASAC